MSEERDEIDAQNDNCDHLSPDDHDTMAKIDSVLDGQQDPPMVTATLVPMEPTAIIDDAEPVPNYESTVIAAQVMFEEDGLSTLTDGSSYVESTSISVPSISSLEVPSRSSYLARQSTSMLSTYTSAAEEAMGRRESSLTFHEVVQIDAIEDSGQSSDSSSTMLTSQEEENIKYEHMQRQCRIYLAVAVMLFVSGAIGMIFVGMIRLGKDTGQTFPLLPPSAMMPLAPTTPPTVMIGPPVSGKPSISASPSQMPSCSGNFNQVSSVQVAQSGSNYFTMSDAGDTIVVANYHYQLKALFLETFAIQNAGIKVLRSESSEAFYIHDMHLSGDGSRLVLGVNSYPQQSQAGEEPSNQVGGAMLQFDRLDVDVDLAVVAVEWRTRHVVLTQGGFYSSVVNVGASTDGTTVAFVADTNGVDGFYVEVYREKADTSKLERLGQRLSQANFDANTVAQLSGSGTRLFVVTSDNKVQVFEMLDKNWNQLGDTIIYEGSTPQVYSSYNGTIVVLGSKFQFPVAVFEERSSYGDAMEPTYDWYELGKLDITTSSEAQHVAISGDGRNVVVGEKLADEQIVARLFRRSGSVFAQVQDMMLPGGDFRGMTLGIGGEQLVVAVDETIATYRKDCAGGQ